VKYIKKDAAIVLEIMHTDICGPFNVKWYMVLIG
jgi:hypothetical protein